MTQRQRRVKSQRAGARRRKVNAAVVAWKKMNPGKKLPAAVRVKRLTGGGFSVTPVKVKVQNAAAPFPASWYTKAGFLKKQYRAAARRRNASYRKVKKEARKFQRLGMLEPGPMYQKWRKAAGISKSGRRRSR